MELTKTLNGNEIVLHFVGRVDTTTAAEFEEEIAKEIKVGRRVVVDFSNIDYISSAGLRALLASHKQCANVGGVFVVKNMNNDVLEVFDITGFASILNIEG